MPSLHRINCALTHSCLQGLPHNATVATTLERQFILRTFTCRLWALCRRQLDQTLPSHNAAASLSEAALFEHENPFRLNMQRIIYSLCFFYFLRHLPIMFIFVYLISCEINYLSHCVFRLFEDLRYVYICVCRFLKAPM